MLVSGVSLSGVLLVTLSATTAMRQGQDLFQSGKFDEAERQFQEACRAASSESWQAICLHSFGAIEYQRGRFSRAEDLYRRAQELWEKDPNANRHAWASTTEALADLSGLNG